MKNLRQQENPIDIVKLWEQIKMLILLSENYQRETRQQRLIHYKNQIDKELYKNEYQIYFYFVYVATYKLIVIEIRYIKKQQYLIFLSNFLVIIRIPKMKTPEIAKEIIKNICYPSIKQIVKKQKHKSIITISMMRKQ
ncbi:unnamed protein product [Paramecium pentaurelia]|uniref:Uncharacterized protein n=1 Tax=Paramecium pentaurelia TaxID=43138 RepID=A0A8S1SQI5_9CILI|nr:unnamed protein product [Paramecium pentaurelia]